MAAAEEKYIEPTYLMRPYEEKKFSPSAARQISQEVCAAILEGKAWTGDGEEVVWTVQIAEQVKNRLKGAWAVPCGAGVALLRRAALFFF